MELSKNTHDIVRSRLMRLRKYFDYRGESIAIAGVYPCVVYGWMIIFDERDRIIETSVGQVVVVLDEQPLHYN